MQGAIYDLIVPSIRGSAARGHVCSRRQAESGVHAAGAQPRGPQRAGGQAPSPGAGGAGCGGHARAASLAHERFQTMIEFRALMANQRSERSGLLTEPPPAGGSGVCPGSNLAGRILPVSSTGALHRHPSHISMIQ